jgi:Cys-rich repeat protein
MKLKPIEKIFTVLLSLVLSFSVFQTTLAVPYECAIDSDCPSGQFCDASKTWECAPRQGSGGTNTGNTITCPEGTVSKNGVCVPNGGPGAPGSFAKIDTLGQLIKTVLQYLLYLAGAIAVIFIVVGGYQYITAAGNEESAEKGKKTLINALIGLIAIVMAFAIVQIVTNTLTNGQTGTGGNSNPNNVQYDPNDPRSVAP